ncbi:MAG: glycosyltransferase [Acidobacteria bacterium]|nr:glycosyltransferase [Acidobacteriota bacterium]
MQSSLYICYFGLDQPLVQTQVIPYLRELARAGFSIKLLTFEPNAKSSWPSEKASATRSDLATHGIDWHFLPYHKSPSALATAWDVAAGVRWVRTLLQREKIDILHGRAHVPTLIAALARKYSTAKPKILFDIRGFMPEEYTDAGVWPENGFLYRITKKVERWLLRESDGIVVLTEAARNLLFPESKNSGFDERGRPIEVIPCCVDFERRFPEGLSQDRDKMRAQLNVEKRFVVTHVGALGGLYLVDEIADFLAAARSYDERLYALFLTQSPPELIVPLLRERGFSSEDYFVGRVEPGRVPAYLSACDAGLSFVTAGYATLSRSPTKIPEYLAAGLPIVANSGVGDVDELITQNGVGVLIDEFNAKNYLQAFECLVALDNVREKCKIAAERGFDLNRVGAVRYQRLYKRLLE